MGFSVSWLARAGTSTQELLDISRREPTGERHSFPDVGWYLLELPNTAQSAWVVLIADGSENLADLNVSQAESLSNGGNETLHFWCSDTVMATELACFKNGAEAWSIQYDSQDAMKQPDIKGDIPRIAHEILQVLRTKQQADDGADYIYDLTAELGLSLVGFRHDTDLEIDDPEPFQVLGEPTRGRSWWQIWKR